MRGNNGCPFRVSMTDATVAARRHPADDATFETRDQHHPLVIGEHRRVGDVPGKLDAAV
jgi:hypothetical protein